MTGSCCSGHVPHFLCGRTYSHTFFLLRGLFDRLVGFGVSCVATASIRTRENVFLERHLLSERTLVGNLVRRLSFNGISPT